MKKLLNFILSLVTLAYLAVFVISQLAIQGVMEAEFLASEFMQGFLMYAPLILLSLFALLDFSSKSIKLIFLIVLVLVIGAGVVTICFPEILAKAPAFIGLI